LPNLPEDYLNNSYFSRVERILIRAAKESDGPEIARLSDQLGYPSTEQQMKNRVDFLVTQSDHVVLVAENGTGLIGWIHLTVRHLIESDPFVEINGIVVDSRFRGRGVGKELIWKGRDWAQNHKIYRIRVRTNVERDESPVFYERLGFKQVKQQLIFDIHIKI